ncbi:MipA/OmpV family protein [Janthinobacterium sp. GW460P]|uniref:MipA/OmpV family protein n=1 Tax=unclassified Janthinobacterium TaxID=2610881 RepID=UPI000A327AFF|nr:MULTISPECIES: MipA/OmpV family protein [unclassified Janthinobacterium]MCC7700846.1 MipA/OmpV family protein [Janthinobacterium sp. GW460P]MCC7706353.1 MipA/OmpV family protein [Janthinobacterium sp. GW460W]
MNTFAPRTSSPLLPMALLLAACGPALADGSGALMMPDGSRDMYVGAAVTGSSATDDGAPRGAVLRPLLQVQWSNGVFVSASGVAGMHLSATPGVEYGPLLAASNARDPEDGRRLRGTRRIEGSPDVGGFYGYYLDERTRVSSTLLYDTSARGWRGQLGLQKTLPSLAPHHTLTLSAGVALASGTVMDERYAVSFAAGGARDYRPAGGVTAVEAGINWNWALSSKWLVNSAVTGTRLGSGPAHSPVIERRHVITWSSGLGYRF